MMTDAFPHVEHGAAGTAPVPPDGPHPSAWPGIVWSGTALVAVIVAALLARRFGPAAIERLRAAWSSLRARRSAAPDADKPARPSPRSAHRAADRAAQPSMRRAALILISIMSGVVALVGVVALALNFEHGRQLASLNGEAGWRACAWPLAVDGLLIGAGLVTLVRRLLGLSAGIRARGAFVTGIAASAGTNIVLALHSPLVGWALVERIGVTTWPTIALLASHEMALQMVAYVARLIDVFGIEGPHPDVVAAQEERDRAAEDARAARALVAELREELASARQSAEADRAEAARTIEDLRADLNEACEQLGAFEDEVDRLRAEAQNRTSANKRTAEEWEQVRAEAQEWARNYVREYGEIPKGPQVAAQAGASERWANNVLKAVMDELLDLRNAHERAAAEVG